MKSGVAGPFLHLERADAREEDTIGGSEWSLCLSGLLGISLTNTFL
jgi:hypothetical protein